MSNKFNGVSYFSVVGIMCEEMWDHHRPQNSFLSEWWHYLNVEEKYAIHRSTVQVQYKSYPVQVQTTFFVAVVRYPWYPGNGRRKQESSLYRWRTLSTSWRSNNLIQEVYSQRRYFTHVKFTFETWHHQHLLKPRHFPSVKFPSFSSKKFKLGGRWEKYSKKLANLCQHFQYFA
jgi:hypothetical protein